MEEEQKTIELAAGSYQNLNNFARLIYSWLQKDMDCVVAVSGAKGVGKSTLAMQIAIRYLRLIGKKFDVERNVAYTFNEIIAAINTLEKGDVLIIDEAVNVMMSEDWNKFESKYLKKVFAKLRVKHLLVFICIPDFFWLDKKYREMVHFWIYVFKRGKAIVFTPNLAPAVQDPWYTEWLKQKLNFHYSYFSPSSIVERMLARHPGFFDFIEFPPLDKEIYQKYMVKREQAVLEAEVEVEKASFIKKAALLLRAVELRKQGVKQAEIAKLLGVSEATLSVWFSSLKKEGVGI